MSVEAIGAVGSESNASAIAAAQQQLLRAQQQLAADAAAKASQTTIAADQMAELSAQLAVTEASNPTSTALYL
jgi:hypothetical protein